jgi:hypothetical protein
MIGLEVNDAVILEQQKVLEAALSTNPKTQKALQKLIRKALMEVRPELVSAARGAMGSDPRGAAQGIRLSVYKKILGGNVNILNSRKAGKPTTYEPPRKLQPGQRGGNRVPRGKRTDTVMHYGPYDRGFILRFQNDGTANRNITKLTRVEGTNKYRWSSLGGTYGNRGSIKARHWFKGLSEEMLVAKADELANLIDTELENILNKKK